MVGVTPDSFVQFCCDNVDHNIATLDGSGTFYGMGIIAATTPSGTSVNKITRGTNVSASKVSPVGKVPIRFFNVEKTEFSFAYDVLKDVQAVDQIKRIDTWWKVSWPLRSPRPGWSGYMQ